MEVEYVAAAEAAKEAVWVRKFLLELGVVSAAEKPIVMYCDNSGAVAQYRDPGIIRKASTFRENTT